MNSINTLEVPSLFRNRRVCFTFPNASKICVRSFSGSVRGISPTNNLLFEIGMASSSSDWVVLESLVLDGDSEAFLCLFCRLRPDD